MVERVSGAILTAPIRVLIADDDPLQREGYRMILDSQPDIEVVGQSIDGAKALAALRRTPVDVVLMDIQMPNVNGLDAAVRVSTDAAVKRFQSETPRVVLVAAMELEEHLAAAASAGAWAVLFKDVPPEGLLEAIRGAASDHEPKVD